jgi:hypothetical protein
MYMCLTLVYLNWLNQKSVLCEIIPDYKESEESPGPEICIFVKTQAVTASVLRPARPPVIEHVFNVSVPKWIETEISFV